MQQPDGYIRVLCYLSRTTLNNERKWSVSELECAAIMRAIKRNRQILYGTPFGVETDHQPLQNLESLSDKRQEQLYTAGTDMVLVPECVHFYAEVQIEERQRQRRCPVAPSFH